MKPITGIGRWGKAVMVEFESAKDSMEFFWKIDPVLRSQIEQDTGVPYTNKYVPLPKHWKAVRTTPPISQRRTSQRSIA
jgi:hypothetical protein